MVGSASNKLLLYWHTLKWLKPVQWRYRFANVVKAQVHRRFPEAVKRSLLWRVPANVSFRTDAKPVAWFEKRHDGTHGMFQSEDILSGRFTFLNCSKQFAGEVVWKNPEFTYLWDFNLHYFEYLESLASSRDDLSEKTIRLLLSGWVEGNPCPVEPAWHPYPISLRTINWVKLFVNHPQFAEDRVLYSLHAQLLFLERNLEKHLLGNHLLENGRALLFGGLFFEGQAARRWLDKGLCLLKQEIKEEYLPNGGHFERSPMYHCILLEGLLDTFVYLEGRGHDATWLSNTLTKMCEWLEDIQCPGDTIPLFNDAAIGISATPEEILSNAERLLGYGRRKRLESIRDCDQFFVFDAGSLFCVVDGAPIGPSYIPGHAHSDNFTFELYSHGRRLVVDAGTFSYNVNPERIASRSTAAHNTVVINGLGQSEVWGGFRVARRSNPTLSRAGYCGDYFVFQGKYTNCVDPSQGITHERIFVINPSNWVLVWDTIEANGGIQAESFCRFAPDWVLCQESDCYSIQHLEQEVIYMYPLQVDNSTLRESSYSPEFGKMLPAQQVAFLTMGHRYVETGYLLTSKSFSAQAVINIKRKEDSLTIYLNDTLHQIDLGDIIP